MIDPRPHNGNRFFALLRKYFFTGLLVTTPIAITLFVTWWFLRFIDTAVADLIPARYNPNYYLPVYIPGLGLIICVMFFIIVGWFARNYFGKLTLRVSEYFLDKMPVVRTIYTAIKQVMEMMVGKHARAFRDVVLFQYPMAGCWTVGFVTGVTPGEVQSLDLDGGEVVNVYVPTTPNPTNGFLLFMPKKDLIYIDMSVEEAVKLIVSGGIITPPPKEPVVN